MNKSLSLQKVGRIINMMRPDLVVAFDKLITEYGTSEKLIEISIVNAEIPVQFFMARCVQEFEKRTETKIDDASKMKICYLILASGITKKTLSGGACRLLYGPRQSFQEFLITEGATPQQAKVISNSIAATESVIKSHFEFESEFIKQAIDDLIYCGKELSSYRIRNTSGAKPRIWMHEPSSMEKVFRNTSYYERDGVYLGTKVHASDKGVIDDIVKRLIYCSTTFSFYAGKSPYHALDAVIESLFWGVRSMFMGYYHEPILKYAEAYLQQCRQL